MNNISAKFLSICIYVSMVGGVDGVDALNVISACTLISCQNNKSGDFIHGIYNWSYAFFGFDSVTIYFNALLREMYISVHLVLGSAGLRCVASRLLCLSCYVLLLSVIVVILFFV